MEFHGLQLDLSGFDGSLIEVLEAAVDFRYEISRTVFPDFFQVPKPSSRVFSGQQASPMVWYIYIYIYIAPVLTWLWKSMCFSLKK
jgi:hypothetical protein